MTRIIIIIFFLVFLILKNVLKCIRILNLSKILQTYFSPSKYAILPPKCQPYRAAKFTSMTYDLRGCRINEHDGGK